MVLPARIAKIRYFYLEWKLKLLTTIEHYLPFLQVEQFVERLWQFIRLGCRRLVGYTAWLILRILLFSLLLLLQLLLQVLLLSLRQAFHIWQNRWFSYCWFGLLQWLWFHLNS